MDAKETHNRSKMTLAFFTVFSRVARWTHTLVSLVCKSNQASCIVVADVEAALVLMGKDVEPYFS